MLAEGQRIGLIAGRGAFPVSFAEAARRAGHHVTALALTGFASEALATHVDAIHWLGVGQLDTLIRLCRENEITQLALAGKVDHGTVFDPGKIEPRAFGLLARLGDRRAVSLVGALIEELEREDIHVLDSSLFLQAFLPPPGLLTANRPISRPEQRDIEFAWPLARQIAAMDIGLCLAVKNGVVVAVEGLEGTDEMIRRGGRLAGAGTVIVKVSRPRQDFRFDLPVVGLQTIRSMAEVGASTLAICANETLFFDQADAIELAERSNIGVIAWPAGPPSAPEAKGCRP